MAMIQGIDGSALIQAFRAGRQDQYANQDRLRKIQQEEAAQQRQQQVSGLVQELFAGRQPAGVAEQFSGPQAAPKSFTEAFNPQTMEAFGRGEDPAQPSIPAMPAQAPPRQPNPDVLTQLIVLDPEMGAKIAGALKSMDEMKLAQFEKRNNFMGAAARYVAQGKTPQERLQRFQIATPQLLEAGFTPEELDGIDNDLSDQRLQFFMATAIDYDKMIDNELAEREFQAGKNVPVTAGGSVVNVRPDGTASYVVGGGSDGGGGDIPQEAIEALRNGEGTPEQFDEWFGEGAAARIMGGGGGDVTEGFPGGAG